MEGIESFIGLQKRLLQEESCAEKEELDSLLDSLPLPKLVEIGLAICRIVVCDVWTGLNGRTIAKFLPKSVALSQRHSAGKGEVDSTKGASQIQFSQHRFTPGDIVGLFPHGVPISCKGAVATGVVYRVTATAICVAFDDDDSVAEAGLRTSLTEGKWSAFNLTLASSTVTLDRQREALDRLLLCDLNKPFYPVLNTCFFNREPRIRRNIFRAAAEDSDAISCEDCAVANWGDEVQHAYLSDLDTCFGVPWYNEELMPSQKHAVFLGLQSLDVALIHGPPGTGKTTTVAELILQLVARGKKVLACAASNVAVDNLMEHCVGSVESRAYCNRLRRRVENDSETIFGGKWEIIRRRVESLKSCIRIGHPARIDDALVGFCLDSQYERSDAWKVVRNAQHSLDKSLRELSRMSRTKGADVKERGSARRQLLAEVKALRRDVRLFQKTATREALEAAPVVFATCVGAADQALQRFVEGYEGSNGAVTKGRPFDVVVIDEAAQALEASCWIPLQLGRRCVLAGDHQQLAPTVKSRTALKEGLGVTLFERLMAAYGGRISQLLNTQFRMNSTIMQWSSNSFYEGSLIAAQCAAGRTLAQKYSSVDQEAAPPLLWIDTAGLSWLQEDEPSDEIIGVSGAVCSVVHRSKSNRAEAALVVNYAKELVVTYGVTPDDIGIITPYSKQARLIKLLLQLQQEEIEPILSSAGNTAIPALASITVSTVDGFQGREKEVIVISMVRSNSSHSIGFLSDARRLNVAVTRARRHLVLVGNSETVTSHSDQHSSGVLDSPKNGGVSRVILKSNVASGQSCGVLEALYHHACTEGSVRSAEEFINISDIPSYDECETVLHGGSQSHQLRPNPAASKESRRTAVHNDAVGATRKSNSKTINSSCKVEPAAKTRPRTALLDKAVSSVILENMDPFESEVEGLLTSLINRSVHEPCSHTFPASLTSYQRMIVHEVADRMGLVHISQGYGNERFIKVQVKGSGQHDSHSVEQQRFLKDLNSPKNTEPGLVADENEDSPSSSAALFSEGTPLSKKLDAPISALSKKRVKAATSARRRAAGQTKPPEVTKTNVDDFDALLEQYQTENWSCNFSKCKTAAKTLGRFCPHCNKRYCIVHSMPEVHGCGDAASKDARREFRSKFKNDHSKWVSGTDIRGGSNPSSTGNSSLYVKDRLRETLHKSIEEKARSRTKQSKSRNT